MEERTNPLPREMDSRPVPDPTLLTTQQLYRVEVSLRDFTERSVKTIYETLMTRLDGMERLRDEKFASVAAQFRELDARIAQSSQDRTTALTVAFAAQRQAAEKSEAAVTKQMDALDKLLQSTKAALDDKIDDIKDRVTLTEGKTAGQTVMRTESHTSQSFVVAVIVGIVAVGMFLLTMLRDFGTK